MTDQHQQLTATQEDYLETIYVLTEKNKVARNKDIADMLNVKRATVTGAIKSLAEKELINYETHGFITLTEKGFLIAKKLREKHCLFTYFFKDILGLKEKEAEDIACSVEHVIKGEALKRFKILIESVDNCTSPNRYFPPEEEE